MEGISLPLSTCWTITLTSSVVYASPSSGVRVSDLSSLLPLISEQDYRPDLDRYRCWYIYRGMSDVSFPLQTSLRRNCKDKMRLLEGAILKNFTKYAAREDPSIERSVWRQMILGQHHGLPTRLLDWSHSSLIGLHFAVTEADMDEMEAHDSVVWRIDMTELHTLLPEKYKRVLRDNRTNIFSVDMLTSVAPSPEVYDQDMGSSAMVVIEPPSIDPHIINQYSFFSVLPSDMEDMESFLEDNTSRTVKYVIDRKLRWRVRDMLDQQNISERIVYPGLDGLSRWIGRHYYVK